MSLGSLTPPSSLALTRWSPHTGPDRLPQGRVRWRRLPDLRRRRGGGGASQAGEWGCVSGGVEEKNTPPPFPLFAHDAHTTLHTQHSFTAPGTRRRHTRPAAHRPRRHARSRSRLPRPQRRAARPHIPRLCQSVGAGVLCRGRRQSGRRTRRVAPGRRRHRGCAIPPLRAWRGGRIPGGHGAGRVWWAGHQRCRRRGRAPAARAGGSTRPHSRRPVPPGCSDSQAKLFIQIAPGLQAGRPPPSSSCRPPPPPNSSC